MPRAMMDFQITVNVCKCASEGVPVASHPARGITHTFQSQFYGKLFSQLKRFSILQLLAYLYFMLRGIVRLSEKKFHFNRSLLDGKFQHVFGPLQDGVLLLSAKLQSLCVIGGSCRLLKRTRLPQFPVFFQFWGINIVEKTKRYCDRSARAVSVIQARAHSSSRIGMYHFLLKEHSQFK